MCWEKNLVKMAGGGGEGVSTEWHTTFFTVPVHRVHETGLRQRWRMAVFTAKPTPKHFFWCYWIFFSLFLKRPKRKMQTFGESEVAEATRSSLKNDIEKESCQPVDKCSILSADVGGTCCSPTTSTEKKSPHSKNFLVEFTLTIYSLNRHLDGRTA